MKIEKYVMKPMDFVEEAVLHTQESIKKYKAKEEWTKVIDHGRFERNDTGRLAWVKKERMQWNWDEEWDGLLVEIALRLSEVGIHVSHIYHKGKIRVSWKKEFMPNRGAFLSGLIHAFEDDEWDDISFFRGKSQAHIQFKITSARRPKTRWW